MGKMKIKHMVYLSGIIFLVAGCEGKPPEGMILIPAGEFVMGSEEVDTEARALQFGSKKPWFVNERPKRKVYLGAYYIDKYEVTNAEYKKFIDAKKRRPPNYWVNNNSYPPGAEDYPVASVNWYDADAYCKWAGKKLPTEAEWEKAARGTDGRRFPWGDVFDEKKCNCAGQYRGVMPAGRFEAGKSPYGVYDMAGNVYEWVSDWYLPYPDSDYNDEDFGEKFKISRGGGWGGIGHYPLEIHYRTSFRFEIPPQGEYNDLGFRCTKDG